MFIFECPNKLSLNNDYIQIFEVGISLCKLFESPHHWPLLQVTEKKAREWCASRGDMPYFETSAKEGYNVEEAFLCVAKVALENEHTQDM